MEEEEKRKEKLFLIPLKFRGNPFLGLAQLSKMLHNIFCNQLSRLGILRKVSGSAKKGNETHVLAFVLATMSLGFVFLFFGFGIVNNRIGLPLVSIYFWVGNNGVALFSLF